MCLSGKKVWYWQCFDVLGFSSVHQINLEREMVNLPFTGSQALVRSTLAFVHNALECRLFTLGK
jgi:hypothetical protein